MMIYFQMIETREECSKFERIYTEYKGLMYHVAFKVLQHEQDAEDALHLAFVSIAENITAIEEPGPKTKSYVALIAENKAIDILRKRQRYVFSPLDQKVAGIAIEYDGSNSLTRCINQLPSLQRQVIWLKYHYGYNLREIAKMLHISHIWASKLDQRAKTKLRELCIKEGYQL